MKKDKPRQYIFENNHSCGHADCESDRIRHTCRQCGRFRRKGKVIIEVRNGFIYYERMNLINIKEYVLKHNKSNAILYLWIPPGELFGEYTIEGVKCLKN